MSKVHHLIHIHDKPSHPGFHIYYVGCGRKWLLKDKGLKNCSHIELVDCKKCIQKYKKKAKK